MPAVVYYNITRRQEVVVASAYGELAAIEAGVAAMDGDMRALERLASDEGLPEGHGGPKATVREKVKTVSLDCELRGHGY